MPKPKPHPSINSGLFSGIELLSTAVVLVDAGLIISHINPSAENLFAISHHKLLGMPLSQLLGAPPGLAAALDKALHRATTHSL